MANYASLSEKQVDALKKFMVKHIPKSTDELIKEVGQEEAFTLLRLKTRFEALTLT